MKKQIAVNLLSLDQIAFLEAHCPPRTFLAPEALVYSGQVPQAGYVLLEGKITFDSRNKTFETVPKNSMICVKELLSNSPVPRTIQIHPNSKVLILDKSSVLEMLRSPQGRFFEINLPA
ncbi:MAG: cyclic nucleotide-binding domain-containing protein [Bacteriovoracaceae bacterium]